MIAVDDTTPTQLQRIADVLRIPVEALFDGAEPRRLTDTNECLRLWDRLRTDAGRAAALDYLRKALDEEAS